MAEEPFCHSLYYEEYIQTSVSDNSEWHVIKLTAFFYQRDDECRIFW